MKPSALMFLSAAADSLKVMQPALVVLIVILTALVISSIIFTVIIIRSERMVSNTAKLLLSFMYITVAICLVCTILCGRQYALTQNEIANSIYQEQFGNMTTTGYQ